MVTVPSVICTVILGIVIGALPHLLKGKKG